MQINSNSRLQAPNEARKFKKLILVKISRKGNDKGLNIILLILTQFLTFKCFILLRHAVVIIFHILNVSFRDCFNQ